MASSQLILDTVQELLERKEDVELKSALVLIQRLHDDEETVEIRMSDRVHYNKIAVFHVRGKARTVQPVLNNWFDIDTLYGLSDEIDDAIDLAVLDSMMQRLCINEGGKGYDTGEWEKSRYENDWEKIEYAQEWEEWAESRFDYDY